MTTDSQQQNEQPKTSDPAVRSTDSLAFMADGLRLFRSAADYAYPKEFQRKPSHPQTTLCATCLRSLEAGSVAIPPTAHCSPIVALRLVFRVMRNALARRRDTTIRVLRTC